MRKQNTEYKLKLGRLTRDLLIKQKNKSKQSKNKKVPKLKKSKHKRYKKRSKNTSKFSLLPYQKLYQNLKTNKLSSSQKFTKPKKMFRTQSQQQSMRTSRISWKHKQVTNNSMFTVRNSQKKLGMSDKNQYFEKMIDGKLKLFRTRLVPIDDLNELGNDHELNSGSCSQLEENLSHHDEIKPEFFIPEEIKQNQLNNIHPYIKTVQEENHDPKSNQIHTLDSHQSYDLVMTEEEKRNREQSNIIKSEIEPLFNYKPNQDKDDPRNYMCMYTASQFSDTDTNEFN